MRGQARTLPSPIDWFLVIGQDMSNIISFTNDETPYCLEALLDGSDHEGGFLIPLLEVRQTIAVVKADITKIKADAIVNSAHRSLMGGGGVDGAIHRAAGKKLKEACVGLGPIDFGEARITLGFDLKAKWVIHVAGPRYWGEPEEPLQLVNCYKNALDLALENHCASVAFPGISTGVYRYPKEDATDIAVTNVLHWCRNHSDTEMTIVFCCVSQEMFEMYKNRFK